VCGIAWWPLLLVEQRALEKRILAHSSLTHTSFQPSFEVLRGRGRVFFSLLKNLFAHQIPAFEKGAGRLFSVGSSVECAVSARQKKKEDHHENLWRMESKSFVAS
jgi:hypothetical protein